MVALAVLNVLENICLLFQVSSMHQTKEEFILTCSWALKPEIKLSSKNSVQLKQKHPTLGRQSQLFRKSTENRQISD